MKIIHNEIDKQINFLDERFYQSENSDEFYPSVTTVLDVYPKGAGFIQWLKDLGNNADDVVKRAAESGSKVHNAIDQYLQGNTIEWQTKSNINYTLEEWLMILKFVEFFGTHKPKVIANELQLVSDKLKLGGTIDLVCMIGDKTWLIDYKTSNAIHTSYELQMAAYAVMWNEAYPNQKIDKTGVMWLKANTRGEDKTLKKIQGKGWQLKEFERNYLKAYKLFEHTRAIWDEENPTYTPKNKIYPSEVTLKL